MFLYGDSMILAECIFSQSAPGEVYRAYFCKLAHILGWLVQIFAKTCAPCVDSSGLTKFPRNVAAAARRREGKMGHMRTRLSSEVY